jgi:hypothetical protein
VDKKRIGPILTRRTASLEWQLSGQLGFCDLSSDHSYNNVMGTSEPLERVTVYESDCGIEGSAPTTSSLFDVQSTATEPRLDEFSELGYLTATSPCSSLLQNQSPSHDCVTPLSSMPLTTSITSSPYTLTQTPGTGEQNISDRMRATLYAFASP